MINSGIVAIDNGGSSTCVVTKKTREIFPSAKGKYGTRNLTGINGRHDFIVDYKNERYVMGNLAKYDSRYPLQMHTDSKQNLFFDLSVLVAIHQYGYTSNHIVTSVPITMHNQEEKYGIIERLIGTHDISVNGNKKSFIIMDVKVAPETAVAFWINEPYGKNRFIDLGSRTIGYATTIHENGINRFIDSESGTFRGKGLETLNSSKEELADYICGKLMSLWDREDDIYLLGGGALDLSLVENIKAYFPKSIVINNPQMANAIGMYTLGKLAYKNLD